MNDQICKIKCHYKLILHVFAVSNKNPLYGMTVGQLLEMFNITLHMVNLENIFKVENGCDKTT